MILVLRLLVLLLLRFLLLLIVLLLRGFSSPCSFSNAASSRCSCFCILCLILLHLLFIFLSCYCVGSWLACDCSSPCFNADADFLMITLCPRNSRETSSKSPQLSRSPRSGMQPPQQNSDLWRTSKSSCPRSHRSDTQPPQRHAATARKSTRNTAQPRAFLVFLTGFSFPVSSGSESLLLFLPGFLSRPFRPFALPLPLPLLVSSSEASAASESD